MSDQPQTVLHAIVTALTEPHDAEVIRLWKELKQTCGLQGIWELPVPHFSWMGMLGYDAAAVEQELREIAAQAHPFTARVSSLGIFTGEDPVIYLALVKDEALLRFHQLVWQRLEPHLSTPNLYYAPSVWVPHITLAIGDVTQANLACVIEQLAFRPWYWEFPVDRIGLISHPSTGKEMSFVFGG